MKITIEIHDGWLGPARGPAEDPGHDRRPGGPADRDGAGRPAAWPTRGAVRHGRPAAGPQWDGTRETTIGARPARTTTSTRRTRRTRRRTGGSCWDGAPSRCPTPRGRSSATARSGDSRAGWSTGGRTRSRRRTGSPGRGRTGPADRRREQGRARIVRPWIARPVVVSPPPPLPCPARPPPNDILASRDRGRITGNAGRFGPQAASSSTSGLITPP